MTKDLEELFYFFEKDYGMDAILFKVVKADTDLDSGVRDESQDQQFPIRVVETPVDQSVVFLAKLTGRTEKTKTEFLIKLKGLPEITLPTDYLLVEGRKYRNLKLEKFRGKVGILYGESSD